MQDRFQVGFEERIAQSRIAKAANLEAFRAALAPDSQDNIESTTQAQEIPPVVVTAGADSKDPSDPKPLLRFIPKRVRTPFLAATAGVAALGAAACTTGSGTEAPQAPTNQGQVLGENVTPVPSVSESKPVPTKSSSGAEYITEGHKIDEFKLTGPYGTFRSSEALGKPMLLFYCCNQKELEATTINNLKASYGRQIVIVPIVINGSLNVMPAVSPYYVEDPYDVNSTNHKFMVHGTPWLIAVDRAQIIVDERRGDDYLVNIDALAQKLIAGSDVTPSDTLTIDESKVGVALESYDSSWDLGTIARVSRLFDQSGQTTTEEAQYISSTISQADQMIKTYGEQQKGAASLTAIAPVGRKLADIYCRDQAQQGIYQGVYNALRELATYATRTYERYAKIGLVDASDWDGYAANFAPNCQVQYPTDN